MTGWVWAEEGFDPGREPWRQTLFALADGVVGVRGFLEEHRTPTDGVFLAGAYETTPLRYHERHFGFAAATDTRTPVAHGARVRIELDGGPMAAELVFLRRELDLRTGLFSRVARWRDRSGAELEVAARRVIVDGALAIDLRLRSLSFTGRVALVPVLDDSRAVTAQTDDPRLGAEIGEGGLRTVLRLDDALAQRTARSGVWAVVVAAGHGRIEADVAPGMELRLRRSVVHACGRGEPPASLDPLRARARAQASEPFDALIARRATELDRFWSVADVTVDGDPWAERALRLNLFQIFQSASRDPDHGTAAKGLTGEGYEGHIFWDTEAFLLPALTFLAPDLVRQALVFRWRRLDEARETARALNHARGALFPWRTIAGRECSAHYPSGSAQYHINGAVAQAVQLYVAATDDRDFLLAHGAELLVETARLWLDLGRWSDGRFQIFGVTGPDEYTALIDNNFYTNKTAALSLAYAAEVASEHFDRLAGPLGLAREEIDAWTAAAAAMYLPRDEALGVDAQDDSFLRKPLWPHSLREPGRRPLLLDHHPMTLYRHRLCKQADLVQAMAFAGDDTPPDRLRRNFETYEPLTTHDSTLSACPFAIVAARVGLMDQALGYFRETAAVDLEDRHRNAAHGSHMAALAGGWLAIAFGFAGLKWRGDRLAFAPVLPPGWRSLGFAVVWKGRRIRLDVRPEGTSYTLETGEPIAIEHGGLVLDLQPQRRAAA